MEGRSSFGHDRDRDRDQDRNRPGSLAENPALPPPQPLSLPLQHQHQHPQLDHRAAPQLSQTSQAPQTSSRAPPLPPLPESPLTTTRPNSGSAGATSISTASQLPGFRANISTRTSAAPADASPPASAPSMQPTIRTVTPEPLDHRRTVTQDAPGVPEVAGASSNAYSSSSSFSAAAAVVPPLRVLGSLSPQGSPRSLSHHGSTTSRRQGVVFSDSVAGPFDGNITSSSPPPRPAVFRQRTHTMDSSSLFREPLLLSAASETRNRVGSFSSSGTADSSFRSTPSLQGPPLDSLLNSYPPIASTRSSEAQLSQTSAPVAGGGGGGIGGITASSSAASISSLGGIGFASPATSATTSSREKKSSSRRLIKRSSSRPTSPLISPPPSVDSLPLPIPTDNANRVLMLMKTLCGRMRGEIEYRSMAEDSWHRGVCYIEEEKGSLMFDAGNHGPFHSALVPDLRGCRVSPAGRPDKGGQCLEVVNAQATVEILFRPFVAAEFDLWLAALLCWQQLRQGPGIVSVVSPGSKPPTSRSTSASTIDSGKRRASAMKVKEGTIIKVGKVMLWDKGAATSPRAIVKRPSTRDLRSIQTAWRRVSCILQGNGEFKLMTENDVTILSVIELSQLGRCAIQQLDKSVLDEEYCIAIFPIYAPTSTQLSIFRPVYIALDSRVAFEVWFVLLRAFAVPDIYALDPSKGGNQVSGITDLQAEQEDAEGGSKPQTPEEQFVELGGDIQPEERLRHRRLFRLEKTLNLRVTEAKIKPRTPVEGSQGLQERTTAERGHERFPDRAREKQEKHDKHDKHDKNNKHDKHDKHDQHDKHDKHDKHNKHDKHDKHDKSGKNSEPQDLLVGNYLAEVILDGEVRARTTIKTDTKNPFWREDCEFGDLPPTLPYLSVVLKRVDGNLDSFTHQLQASLGLPKTGNLREINYGSVDISLINMDKGKDHEQWLPICDDRHQTVGSMLVKIHHEELAVLSAKEYLPVLDILHKFSSGLTLQIAEVMPGSLRRLSEVFLNIFQVSGTAGDWLMALVEDEIDGIGNQTTMKKMRFSRRLRSNESIESSSDREQLVRDMGRSLQGEANLLFRGNSLLTQALEFHMRRLGKEYLEEVLSDKIFEINEINPDCEVDPSKVQPGQDIHKHWQQLMAFTYEVWECIANSAQRFPPELRHILKYIRAVAEDRYGDFLRTVAYTSVSGFLFLRFICPAILNPKLFGMLRDHPRPRAQRTLTLMAKGLQALANLSTIGKKETWMEPMNRFLAQQRQSVKDFIDAVCSIPAEKPNTTQIVPASYSTPITILGRLSPTAREGFPSLPYLIDHTHNIAALVKMWMDTRPLSASTHVYDGELLEFNNLCSELQARSNECYARAELFRQTSDADSSILTTDDSIVDSMEKTSLADTVNLSYGNSTAWMDMAEAGSINRGGHIARGLAPPGSSGSDVDDPYGGRDHKNSHSGAGSGGSGNNSNNDNNGQHYEPGGSIKMLRNGKQARKFLSGIISRKPRAPSPDHVGGAPNYLSGSTRNDERDRDRDQVREREVKERKVWDRGWEQDRDQDSKSSNNSGKDKEKERLLKREKSAKSDKTDKTDKTDKADKTDKTDRFRNMNLGEPWAPSAFGVPNIPSRQNSK